MIAESIALPLGFERYLVLLGDGVTVPVILRTLLMSALAAAFTLLLGYPYAYWMLTGNATTKKLLLLMVLLPFWLSVMARTFAWFVILRDGPIHMVFRLFGIDLPSLLGTPMGVTIAMVQVMLPFMVLPLYNSMKAVPDNQLTAARSLGASRTKAFWMVFFPQTGNGVMAGLLLVFVLSLGFYVAPALLGSPQQSMLAQLIARKVQVLLDLPAAGALSVMLIIALLAVSLLSWALGRIVMGRPADAHSN
ncbi:ABC transporter permease [Microbacterium sp. A93]|uniref:ABC transporter permease n=1 Tax=Microbacterium sp. A93 TaxID=3450716 RepID=UPI003F4391B9